MTHFSLNKTNGLARAGELTTRRGIIRTPFFLSVGTRAAIKGAVSMPDLKNTGAQVLLSNTYHLHLRPSSKVVQEMGGLHKWTGWDKPILTDSGGFQVFSLGRKKITSEGVYFNSHIDGKKFFLSPALSMQIQHELQSDICMVLDVCPPNVKDFYKIRRAVEQTIYWAKLSHQYHFQEISVGLSPRERPQLFGIVQGGCFTDLRKQCLEELLKLNFDGYALGGLAVGETATEMYEVLDDIVPLLPKNKPRYVMGIGTPINLLEAIDRGVDMFDCVMPMRNARHGGIFTRHGAIKISHTKYHNDPQVLDPECSCMVCADLQLSRSYLHHLFRTGEDLGKRLLTIHNLSFYHWLMKEARKKILNKNFKEWKNTMVKQLT